MNGSLRLLEPLPEERDRLLLIAAKYRQFATADARRLIREIPKRPAAPSVRRSHYPRTN
jgi:hypothetical protein